MKLGVVYPQIELGGDPEAVAQFARGVENLGYTHLLAYDHVLGATHDREPKLWGPYTEQDPFHEPLIMFAYLASIVRLEFVTGVIILPQRQTALLARQAADVDLLSGQRLRLGIGIGWNYVEYQALGQDFHTRGKRADEQIGLLRRLWSGELITFEGRFDKIDRACLNPKPKRQIPIWMGGYSEPAYRRGGLLGDGFIFGRDFDVIREGMARVRHYVEESGRNWDAYGRDLLVQNMQTPQQVIDRIKQWRDLGGTHASVVTMRLGLKGLNAHIDYVAEVKQKLGK